MSWHRAATQLPLVLGHRGARARAPENTFAAFDLALDEGADGVELDVRLDQTGEVVVQHDRTLTRVTQGADHRDVERHPWSALRHVDVGQGETMPTLAAVVEWAHRRNARVNVELKSDVTHRERLVARVVALLARESPEQFVLSSFHPGMVWRARELGQRWMSDPLPVALLVHEDLPWANGAPSWRALGAQGIHPSVSLATPERVHTHQRGGAFINVWTVNDPTRASQLANLGVDGLITDDPQAILAALRRTSAFQG